MSDFYKKVLICTLPFMSYGTLLPIERVWTQENSAAQDAVFREERLALVEKIRKECKLKTKLEAYQELVAYEKGYTNPANSMVAAFVELEGIENPKLAPIEDPNLQYVTYLINSRLIKDEMPTEFIEKYKLEWNGEWLYKHTVAASEAIPEISRFLAIESNNGVEPTPPQPQSLGEN
jgi:hypothetical protein